MAIRANFWQVSAVTGQTRIRVEIPEEATDGMGEAMRALAQYVRLGARGADDTLSFDGKTPSGFFRLQRDGGYVLELTSPPSDAETRRRLLNVCARMNGASNCKAVKLPTD